MRNMTSSAFARGIAAIVGVGSKPGGINCVGGFGKKKKKSTSGRIAIFSIHVVRIC
jgi:hypothetical protein